MGLPKSTQPVHAVCRLCSQPCTNAGYGWYHADFNMGAVHGIRAHYAKPMAA